VTGLLVLLRAIRTAAEGIGCRRRVGECGPVGRCCASLAQQQLEGVASDTLLVITGQRGLGTLDRSRLECQCKISKDRMYVVTLPALVEDTHSTFLHGGTGETGGRPSRALTKGEADQKELSPRIKVLKVGLCWFVLVCVECL